jgi:hypothetical protein
MKERNPDENLDFFFYFAIKDGEITLIRQKKENNSFVLPSFIRKFATWTKSNVTNL